MAPARPGRWAVIAGATLLVLGASTYAYAAFTGASSRDLSVATATVELGFGTNRLTIDADDVQPGDTVVRAVTIKSSSSVPLSGARLHTTATVSSDLDADTTHGLQLSIEICSQAWTETLDSGVPVSYTCGGVQDTVLAEEPVIGSFNLDNIDLTAGVPNYLVVTLRLPSSAPDDFAGQTSTIEFAFTGDPVANGFR
jgi:hypothetical protein